MKISKLDQSEIKFAQDIINKTPIGFYELGKLYCSEWKSVSSPTTFGVRFKNSVLDQDLSFIRLSSKKTNNHQTYEIFDNPPKK